MLVLSRQQNESIIIGDNIVITIVDVRNGKVRVGINAPTNLLIHRQEVYEATRRENLRAGRPNEPMHPNIERSVNHVKPTKRFLVYNYFEDGTYKFHSNDDNKNSAIREAERISKQLIQNGSIMVVDSELQAILGSAISGKFTFLPTPEKLKGSV